MSTTDAARLELGAEFGGELVGPGDPSYDETRALFNAMIDKRPAVIARCASANDVAHVIAFARAHDLPLAVRGGGHNGGGLGSVDDGVVADLSPLRSVSVDAQARTVRVGGGCTWAEVDAATHEHGLAVPCGVISTTGVGGLTLGGGIGHLTRGCGLTIDNLLAAEVVLADGEQVRASADENAELFWALRGGGGNFGVVTEFTFRAHPVSDVVGGPTFWPLEQTDDVLAAYRSARNALIGINTIALVVFWVLPVAPPRLIPGSGFVDSAVVSDVADKVSTVSPDLYAAMPSLHVAWATWVALQVLLITRHRAGRVLAVAHATLTFVAVIATANHYLLDVVAGAVLAVAVVLWSRRRLSIDVGCPHVPAPRRGGRPADRNPAGVGTARQWSYRHVGEDGSRCDRTGRPAELRAGVARPRSPRYRWRPSMSGDPATGA